MMLNPADRAALAELTCATVAVNRVICALAALAVDRGVPVDIVAQVLPVSAESVESMVERYHAGGAAAMMMDDTTWRAASGYRATLLALFNSPPPVGAKRWTCKLLAAAMEAKGYKRSVVTVNRTLKLMGCPVGGVRSRPSTKQQEVITVLLSLMDSPPPGGARRWSLRLLADAMSNRGRSYSLGYISLLLSKAGRPICPSRRKHLPRDASSNPTGGRVKQKSAIVKRCETLLSLPPPAGAKRWTCELLAAVLARETGTSHNPATLANRLRDAGLSTNPDGKSRRHRRKDITAPLLAMFRSPPPKSKGRWSCQTLAAELESQTGIKVSRVTVSRVLIKAGSSK